MLIKLHTDEKTRAEVCGFPFFPNFYSSVCTCDDMVKRPGTRVTHVNSYEISVRKSDIFLKFIITDLSECKTLMMS